MQTSLTFSNVGTSGVLPDLDRAFKRGISVIRARCRASVLHIFLHPSPQWYNATLHSGGETCPEMEVQCTRLYVHIFPACGHRCACVRCRMWPPAAAALPQRVHTAASTSSRAWTTAASRTGGACARSARPAPRTWVRSCRGASRLGTAPLRPCHLASRHGGCGAAEREALWGVAILAPQTWPPWASLRLPGLPWGSLGLPGAPVGFRAAPGASTPRQPRTLRKTWRQPAERAPAREVPLNARVNPLSESFVAGVNHESPHSVRDPKPPKRIVWVGRGGSASNASARPGCEGRPFHLMEGGHTPARDYSATATTPSALNPKPSRT